MQRSWASSGTIVEHAREAYHKREGHCDVPKSHKEGGENLGLWVADQRTAFKKGKLDPERTRRLEAIGIKWRIRQRTNEATREHPRAAL